MKKSMILAAGMMLATAAFVGCTNDEVIQTSNELKVKVTMGIESRTELGADYSTVTWCAEDQIYLFGDGASATMRLMSGAGKQTAVFSGTVNGFPYKLEKALYPVPAIENGEYSYTLPTQRDYKTNSEAPLFGLYSDGQIVFNNLVAMMRIPLAASENDRVLKLNMPGVAGKLVVNVETGQANIQDGANNFVYVNVPAGEACFVDIPVPAKMYDKFEVSLDDKKIAEGENLDLTDPNTVKVVLNEPQAPGAGTGIDADYVIATSADLLWLAKEVRSGNTFAGKTLAMTADIDLTGINWTPIGSTGKFSGTFDGRENKISNLTVSTEGNASAGLFANAQSGLVKNLTLENVNISGHYKTGAIVGDGICAKVENCHVIGGTITSTPYNNDDANHVGGIVGYLSAEGNAWVKNCSVDGLTITAYRDVAGIVGTANGANGGTPEIYNNVVTNTAIIADQTVEYVDTKDANTGEIVGRNISSVDLTKNSYDNVAITAYISTGAQLKKALANATFGKNIILADGLYDEVIYTKTGAEFNVEALNTNKAVVSGKLIVRGDIKFKNLAFKPSDKSLTVLNTSTYGSYVNKAYTSIVTVNKAAAEFENCEFTELNKSHGANAITYFGEATDKILKIKDCKFSGNSKAIYSKALCEITGSEFNLNGGVGVYIWPRATGNGKVTFTNNVNNSSNSMIAIGCLSQTAKYANLVFNVQGNEGLIVPYAAVKAASFVTDGSIVFANGSLVFSVDSEGKMQ